ncbi:hypothetical protein CR513_40192, partial [Mucuna pruriens]
RIWRDKALIKPVAIDLRSPALVESTLHADSISIHRLDSAWRLRKPTPSSPVEFVLTIQICPGNKVKRTVLQQLRALGCVLGYIPLKITSVQRLKRLRMLVINVKYILWMMSASVDDELLINNTWLLITYILMYYEMRDNIRHVTIHVIGALYEIVYSQPNSNIKKIVFIMKDLSGDTITCILWEKYISKLLSFYERHNFGPIVTILTLVKTKEPQ